MKVSVLVKYFVLGVCAYAICVRAAVSRGKEVDDDPSLDKTYRDPCNPCADEHSPHNFIEVKHSTLPSVEYPEKVNITDDKKKEKEGKCKPCILL